MSEDAPNWRSIRGHQWSDEMVRSAVDFLRENRPIPGNKDARYKLKRRLRYYQLDASREGLQLKPQYVPDDYARTTFRVVPESRVDATLRTMVDDPLFVAYSRDALYSKVVQAGWIGIPRRRVQQFLRNNPMPPLIGLQNVPRRDSVQSYRPKHPNQHWQMDLADMDNPELVRANSGYRYLLVVVDIFSKFLWIRPLKTKESTEIAQHLHSIFLSGDIPLRLQTDQGTEFLGAVNDVCARFGVLRIINAPYSPMTNGVVEVTNKHIKRYLLRFMQQFRDTVTGQPNKRYVDILDRIAFNLNTTKRRVTKLTPFQVHRGSHVDVPVFSEGLPDVRVALPDDEDEVAPHAEAADRRYQERVRVVRNRIATEAERRERVVRTRAPRFEVGMSVRILVAQTQSPGTMQWIPVRVGQRRLRVRGMSGDPNLVPFAFTSRWVDRTYSGTFRIVETRSSTTQNRSYVLAPSRDPEARVERMVDQGEGPAGVVQWDVRFMASMLVPENAPAERSRPEYRIPVDLTLPRPIVAAPRVDFRGMVASEVRAALDGPANTIKGRRIEQYWHMTDGTIRPFQGRIMGRAQGRDKWKVRWDQHPYNPNSKFDLDPAAYNKRIDRGWVFLT